MALVSLMSINVWKLAGDTLNITCNFLYCKHQVHRDFLITLYLNCIISKYVFSYMFPLELGPYPVSFTCKKNLVVDI
jgi:hypothetical protein